MKAIHNVVAVVGDLFQSSSYNLFSMCTQVFKSVIQVQARAALRAAHCTERFSLYTAADTNFCINLLTNQVLAN